MKRILVEIERRRTEFEGRPFFRLLEQPGAPSDIRVMVPRLTFFVFAFQDVLRINEERIETEAYRDMVRTHRKEDAGHEVWFLRDLNRLDIEPELGWVFGGGHRTTRDSSYEVVAEALRASDDRVRLIIPLVLEAAGGVFFSRIFKFFEHAGMSEGLEYFSLPHWEVEQGHTMFEDEQSELVSSIELPLDLYREASEMVERMFAAITRFMDGVYEAMEKSHTPAVSHFRELCPGGSRSATRA